MNDLLTFLQERLQQLEHRKMMIPRYVQRPGAFVGKKDFSLNDLPTIQEQIEETKAAIAGIREYRKQKSVKAIQKR